MLPIKKILNFTLSRIYYYAFEIISFTYPGLVSYILYGLQKKNSNAGDPAPQEEGLVITLENVTEGQYTASPGPDYSFQVKVTSAMPTQGVSVTVTAITDPGGILIPQNLIAPTTDGTITINLTGLEPIRTVKVTVTITSVGKSNNTVTKSFWITNKAAE